MLSRLSFACLSLIALAKGVSPAGEPEPRPPNERESRETIRELIAQLASPRFEDREAAARKLGGMNEAASALREALTSPDAEVRRWAGLILAEHCKRRDAPVLPRMRAFARAGEADRLVEALAGLSPSTEDRAGWEAALDLAGAIAGDRVRRLDTTLHDLFLKDSGTPGLSFIRVEGACPHLNLPARATSLIRAGSVMGLPPRSFTLVASRGDVAAENGAVSVILANGAVRFRGSLMEVSVVVCDGDFAARGMRNCLIIASGNVTVGPDVVTNSFIRAGGAVSITASARASRGIVITHSRIHAGGAVTIPDNATLTETPVKENDPNPLGLVRFFEPARVGVEAEAVEGGMRVTKLHDGKPLTACGLRVGDIILSIEGEKTDTAESFRKHLRRASVREQAALTVSRGGQTLELTCTFPD